MIITTLTKNELTTTIVGKTLVTSLATASVNVTTLSPRGVPGPQGTQGVKGDTGESGLQDEVVTDFELIYNLSK